LGKSILAVQIANAISEGKQIPAFKLEAAKQAVLYFDFELSEKQFEARYSKSYQSHYEFDSNIQRAEINPERSDYKEYGFNDFDGYLNDSFERSIKETGAKVLIIDNITYLKDETEKAKFALPLMKHLQALKKKYFLSIFALAHTPKRDQSRNFMGRWSTGALTTGEALRIELSYLLKVGIIKKGCEIHSSLSWTSGANIKIETNYHVEAGYYIRLIYTKTESETDKTNHDYKIYLDEVPSNLGKGNILYFICPVSGNRCRVLYMCYGSQIFKSRLAYQHRIYYKCQISSKMDHANSRYWSIDGRIENLKKDRRKQLTYKGKPTKYALHLARLEEERDYFDNARFGPLSMPKSIRGLIYG